jgi:hypothetical protein
MRFGEKIDRPDADGELLADVLVGLAVATSPSIWRSGLIA